MLHVRTRSSNIQGIKDKQKATAGPACPNADSEFVGTVKGLEDDLSQNSELAAKQNQTHFLRSCYVASHSLKMLAHTAIQFKISEAHAPKVMPEALLYILR